jgi:hypothetical protein
VGGDPGPTDPDFSSVVLLVGNENGSDGSSTFDDASNNNHTIITTGNAQWDSAQSPSGLSTSILFDGTGDLISAADHASLDIGGSEFTLDGWLRTTTTVGTYTFFCKQGTAASFNAGPVIVAVGTSLQFYASSNGTSFDIASARVIGTIAADTWYHFCVMRSGNTFSTHLNGVLGTLWTSSLAILGNTNAVSIGGCNDATQAWNGWGAAVRFTSGVARYVDSPQTNISVPSLPLPTS